MSHNRSEPSPEQAVSPWMASILMRRDSRALERFARTFYQLSAMPRTWRRQLRRKAAVGLASAALALALVGPMVAAPAFPPSAPRSVIVVADGEVANITNGTCGLLEAVTNAVATEVGHLRPDCLAGDLTRPDHIELPVAGLFELTQPYESYSDNGLPHITAEVIIEGHGATIRRTTVSGTPDFRILVVDSDGTLTLRDVVIEGGYILYGYRGGGILSRGTLTLDQVTVSGNKVVGMTSDGGGIYASGPLTIVNSTISHNVAGSARGASGGGIYAAGPLIISNSIISGNHASGMNSGIGGGVYIHHEVSDATITRSRISDNFVAAHYYANGAGLAVNGHVIITDSIISNNINGGSTSGGEGGGIDVWGKAEIRGSTISGNVVESPYVVRSNGEVGQGGGVHSNGDLLIVNSTISNNRSALGGGLALKGETDIVQSTISGNAAQIVAPGSPYGGQGGGLFIGAQTAQPGQCQHTTLAGVILAGNTADLIGPEGMIAPGGTCAAATTVNAFNLLGHNSSAGLVDLKPGPTDIVPAAGLSAILDPIADNSGPAPTHALPAGSPALDRVPNAQCDAAPVRGVDQRGQPRNVSAGGETSDQACDVGAFEWQRAGTTSHRLFLPSVGAR